MTTTKIASPKDLAQEIRSVLAYCESEKPSRMKLAGKLASLAKNVLGGVDFLDILMDDGETEIDAAKFRNKMIGHYEYLSAMTSQGRDMTRKADEALTQLGNYLATIEKEMNEVVTTLGRAPKSPVVERVIKEVKKLEKFPSVDKAKATLAELRKSIDAADKIVHAELSPGPSTPDPHAADKSYLFHG